MKILLESGPNEFKTMNTMQLRSQFLVDGLMVENEVKTCYTMYDRMILGCAYPISKTLTLDTDNSLKSAYFLERREIGIINVGGSGTITADGKTFKVEKLSCLYLGKGTQKVMFHPTEGSEAPAYFFLSTPAHIRYDDAIMAKEDASPVRLGEANSVNQRTIYKYIHSSGIKSCQLVMGLTMLEPGNIWNTMPAHTHLRRSEVYFYFDLKDDNMIIHVMGEPQETRHLVVRNHQAIISPPWSIHSGAGTSHYAFIWAMGGENQDFTDMDFVAMKELV